MAVKEKVLDLANKISRTKRGSKTEIKPEYPEYRILEPVVTEEMAELALCLEFRVHQTAEELAARSGKTLERTQQLLKEMVAVGVTFFEEKDGVTGYYHDLWVPGHMEVMVNTKENVRKFPEIATCFDEYGKRRAPMSVGNFPVGTGVMRIIPIASSIEGETHRASYEEVSGYLEENTIFSVSDCSCRTAREAQGEGCGHLKEDMCIQLGHAADFYIRTGRGRAITRAEAYEIIKRAEANGLIHSIPNTDGPGKTHAICNCCGCSCLSIRNASMFINPDMIRSNYVSRVDAEKCVACGECVEICPTNALKLGQKICATKPARAPKRDLPYDTEWGSDRWNHDYRTNREVVTESGTSPCKAECPAHIGIQGYIKLAAQGKYREALELIKRENPFPAVCGRICPRKCESACTRADIDDAIAIDDIKKFIAQQDLNADYRYIPERRHEYGKKIAVVGAGPSGLTCAFFLAQDGYEVTVFEKEKTLGGMLSFGIPAFRLEKDVVNAEIDILKEMGVHFQTGVEVGRDLTLAQLRAQDFKAFYVAIGAQAGRKLGLEGEDAQGVLTGVDFLRAVNLGQHQRLSGKVVVIGGGNVAIDVARTAVRVGASSVSMYCLEKRDEMPALPEEIDEALAEHIAIENSWGPKRIIVEGGRVTGVEFRKCVSVFDADKRFKPSYDETATVIVPADTVLVSVGQAMEWGTLVSGSRVEFNPNKTVKADTTTLQTAEPDIFAGGDALTGPKFAIDAIAMGKEAAISIHRFVQKGQSLTLGRVKRDYRPLDKTTLDLDGYDHLPRQKAFHEAEKAGEASFRDLRGTLTEEQIKKETERCLSCGATVVDEFMCIGCGACTLKCKFDAIKLVRKYDEAGVVFEKLKPLVMRHIIRRKIRIAAAKPVKLLRNAFSSKKN